MADRAAFVEEGGGGGGGGGPAESPLIAVTFQRNVQRKEKYLEAEPKALGITQMGLSSFQILIQSVFLSQGLSRVQIDIPILIFSLLVVIAGSVAVAAQNLHLQTLRACLGMQIVACGASIVNIFLSMTKLGDSPFNCWHHFYDNMNSTIEETCRNIENTHSHFFAESLLIQFVLIAISATLAAYCCKVANCCMPAPKVPVITVQAPPVQAPPVQQ